MLHEILPVGKLGCNCSVLGDLQTREAIVIDPGDDIEEITAILARNQLHLQAIVITHAHIDHIGGAARLKALTQAPVYMHESDLWLYDNLDMQAAWLDVPPPSRTSIDHLLTENTRLTLGDASFQTLHTPGHTEGSSCLYLPAESLLLAGDTLFRDSIGRTDLPGGNHPAILRSIHQKLLILPEETRVIPGHGAATTIGRERERNPFLRLR